MSTSHINLIWEVPKFWWHAWGAVVLPLIEVLGLAGIVLPLCAFVVRYFEERRKKKSHAEADGNSKQYFRDTVWTPLKTFIILFLLLGFSVGPYEIHYQDEQKIKADESSAALLAARGVEIETLKARLTRTCYNPDRTITQEQHDLLYRLLSKTAEKYHNPHIAIGYSGGDTESARYYSKIMEVLNDAGIVIDKFITKPRHRNSTDPPDLGVSEGLSIQVQSDTPPTPDHPRQQIVMEIFQDFAEARMDMQQYPIGPGNPVISSDRIII